MRSERQDLWSFFYDFEVAIGFKHDDPRTTVGLSGGAKIGGDNERLNSILAGIYVGIAQLWSKETAGQRGAEKSSYDHEEAVGLAYCFFALEEIISPELRDLVERARDLFKENQYSAPYFLFTLLRSKSYWHEAMGAQGEDQSEEGRFKYYQVYYQDLLKSDIGEDFITKVNLVSYAFEYLRFRLLGTDAALNRLIPNTDELVSKTHQSLRQLKSALNGTVSEMGISDNLQEGYLLAVEVGLSWMRDNYPERKHPKTPASKGS